MADKFEDLRTFAAIVDCGGVNAAAAQLGIAKSAVSRRLSDLEARLGVSLIERATRKFTITAVGRDYHRQAIDILAALQRLDEGVASRDETGEVTIAASTTILTHLVVPAIAAMAGMARRRASRFRPRATRQTSSSLTKRDRPRAGRRTS